MLTDHKNTLTRAFKVALVCLVASLSSISSIALAESIILQGTVRDFSDSHPDFEKSWNRGCGPEVLNLVKPEIGNDRKPVLNSNIGNCKGKNKTHKALTSAETFAQWFTNVPGVNEPMIVDLVLEKVGDSFLYDSAKTPLGNTNVRYKGFFPIDGKLLGNQGRIHNYHFTFEMHTKFTYKGGETFSFRGDDDVWVFINDKLVIDVGGVHGARAASVNLDKLGLTKGKSYDFDFFFAERQTNHSNLKITTNIQLEDCVAFIGEVNEVPVSLSSRLKTSDKLFIPSRSISPVNGHLRSYALDETGLAEENADWDAGALMTAASRTSKLYSTDNSGNIIAFNSLDDSAFNANILPVAAIKEYTIDPSTSGGIYRAGRKTGSFLGAISKGNVAELLSNKINTSLYLSDTEYRDYYTNTVTTRDRKVLLSSDDGFLYAFDYETGALSWAWMPRTLVSQLADFRNFQSKHLMSGSIVVLDLMDASGDYATYVVGSYKEGLGHYVLKLNDDGSLDSVVWDDDQSGANFNKAPKKGEMEFFRDVNGKTYGTYVISDSTASTSTLKIKSLTDKSEDMSMVLNYQASSPPFVMLDYGKSNAPANKTLYLGTSIGDIHSAKVLSSNGTLKSSTDIVTDLRSSRVTSMDDIESDPVLYINSSISSKDNIYYLMTQTAKRLTLHRYQPMTSSWKKYWTTGSTRVGTWNESDTFSADNKGEIQSLSDEVIITAKATIVGDAIVLPISILPKEGSKACYGVAYYYLYNLPNGKFPEYTFFNNNIDPNMPDVAITKNILLGLGEARKLNVTDVTSSDDFKGFGISDQGNNFQSGTVTSFNIKDSVNTGIRAWKELGKH